MTDRPAGSLLNYLEQVSDPRGRKGRRHSLSAMLAATCCAMLSGYGSYEAIAQWIHAQQPWLWHALGFTRRPPTAAGFRKVLMVVCPQALHEALLAWVVEGLGVELDEEQIQAVALDGKALRGTRSRHQRALQTLTALDRQTGGILSQQAIDPSTNEAKTALAALKTMVLEGTVIVGDAAYCDREICEEITAEDRKGDYLVIVKDNQPTLHKAAQQSFVVPRSFSPL